jgi:hypothetical protein
MYIRISYIFFLSYSDLFLPTCMCRGLMLHLITLVETHTHTHTRTRTHTQLIEFLWKRDWPFAENSYTVKWKNYYEHWNVPWRESVVAYLTSKPNVFQLTKENRDKFCSNLNFAAFHNEIGIPVTMLRDSFSHQWLHVALILLCLTSPCSTYCFSDFALCKQRLSHLFGRLMVVMQ